MSAALDLSVPTIELGPHRLYHGPNLAMFAGLDDCSVDSCVTDPPYGLSAPPDIAEVLRAWLAGDDYEHGSAGFMGRRWDAFVPGPHIWRELFRVLKPGAHAVVFAGSRTVDLMSMALRIAGFEVRDTGGWLYYQGNPKGLDMGKVIDEDWIGSRTHLKPAIEPWILVRKPLSESSIARNLLRWGTGALNIDACRYAYGDDAWPGPDDRVSVRAVRTVPQSILCYGDKEMPGDEVNWDSHDLGRYPANIYACSKASTAERELGCEHLRRRSAGELTGGRAEGSAGLQNPRAGAGRTSEGRGNHHPTVKPLRLIRWLLRLVTPIGGVVVEPYAGSGTAFIAASQANAHHGLGCTMIGAELGEEEGYIDIAPARYEGWRRLGFPVEVPAEARGANDPRAQATIWDAMGAT